MEILGKFLSIHVTAMGRAMALIAVNLFFKPFLPFLFFWPLDKVLTLFLERFFSWGSAEAGLQYNFIAIDSKVTKELQAYLLSLDKAKKLDASGSATKEQLNEVANEVMVNAAALLSSRRPSGLLDV